MFLLGIAAGVEDDAIARFERDRAGVDFDIPNSAAYLRSWIKALNDDKSLIFKASSKAQAAANHITGATVREEVAA